MADQLIRLDSYPFDSKWDGYDAEGYPVFDRAVGASLLKATNKLFFTNGLFPRPATNLQMTAGEGYNLHIAQGWGIIEGAIGGIEAEEGYNFKLLDDAPRGNKVFSVFLRFDDNDEFRSLYIRIAEGTEIEEPEIAPSVYELRLGYVSIPSNAESMTEAVITDERGLSVCPYAAPFEEIDISEVIAEVKRQAGTQYAAFVDYLEANMSFINSAIDGTAAGALQAAINELRQDALTKDMLDGETLKLSGDNVVSVDAEALAGEGLTAEDGKLKVEATNALRKQLRIGRYPKLKPDDIVTVDILNNSTSRSYQSEYNGFYFRDHEWKHSNGGYYGLAYQKYQTANAIHFDVCLRNGRTVSGDASVNFGVYHFGVNAGAAFETDDGGLNIYLLMSLPTSNSGNNSRIVKIEVTADGAFTSSEILLSPTSIFSYVPKSIAYAAVVGSNSNQYSMIQYVAISNGIRVGQREICVSTSYPNSANYSGSESYAQNSVIAFTEDGAMNVILNDTCSTSNKTSLIVSVFYDENDFYYVFYDAVAAKTYLRRIDGSTIVDVLELTGADNTFFGTPSTSVVTGPSLVEVINDPFIRVENFEMKTPFGNNIPAGFQKYADVEYEPPTDYSSVELKTSSRVMFRGSDSNIFEFYKNHYYDPVFSYGIESTRFDYSLVSQPIRTKFFDLSGYPSIVRNGFDSTWIKKDPNKLYGIVMKTTEEDSDA